VRARRKQILAAVERGRWRSHATARRINRTVEDKAEVLAHCGPGAGRDCVGKRTISFALQSQDGCSGV